MMNNTFGIKTLTPFQGFLHNELLWAMGDAHRYIIEPFQGNEGAF